MVVDYPQANVEKIMLMHNFENLEEDFCNKLVRFARELRRVLKNSSESGINQLSAPFSTRILLRIGAMMNLSKPISIQKAVDSCYSLRLPKIEREYVQRLCNDIFGHNESASEILDGLGNSFNSEEKNLEIKRPARGRPKKIKNNED